MKLKLILLLTLLLIILTSCNDLPVVNRFFGDKTQTSSGRGIIASFSEAPKAGTTLGEEDQFSIVIDISNYIKSDQGVTGTLCLKDLVPDTYGGVTSREPCKSIYLPPAEEAGKQLFAGRPPETIRFPQQGFFSYRGLDPNFPQENQLIAEFSYELSTVTIATGCVAMPQATSASTSSCKGTQNLRIQQDDAPVQISKIVMDQSTIGPNELGLKFEITVKKVDEGILYPPSSSLSDFTPKASVRFNALMDKTKELKCSGLSSGMIEFRKDQNEKIIKCSIPRNLNQEIENVNLDILMEYSFRQIIKSPKFTLKKEEAFV